MRKSASICHNYLVANNCKVTVDPVTVVSYEVLRYLAPGGTSKSMDFWKANFGLFRMMVERVLWETVLKGKGVQKGWTFFKEEALKAQEQAVPMCLKTNRWGR